MKYLLPFVAVVFACSACDSDSVDGNPDYFTSDQIVVDGTYSLFLLNNHDGTASVTYDRSNPTHLNSSNAAKISTYEGDIVIHSEVSVAGQYFSVTGVGDMAFANNSSLSSVVLPDVVRSMGAGAFCNCTSLSSVNIPDGVSVIPDAAFGKCSKMKMYSLPSSVRSIGSLAFAANSALTELVLPDGLVSIGERAFWKCSKLKSLTIPVSVSSVGTNALLQASALKELHVLAAVPPLSGDSIIDSSSKAVLFVPAGSKEAYANSGAWARFSSISEE